MSDPRVPASVRCQVANWYDNEQVTANNTAVPAVKVEAAKTETVQTPAAAPTTTSGAPLLYTGNGCLSSQPRMQRFGTQIIPIIYEDMCK